jgi:hypothetical protein
MKKKSNDRRAPRTNDPDREAVFTRPLESELRLSLVGEWVGGQRPVTEEELRRELERPPAVRLLSFDS